MTDSVNRLRFLLKQKPLCTQSCIKSSLGAERHRELRAKYKLELGIDLMDDRCDNTFNCKSANAGCIGRPFPLDPEIYNALKSMNVNVYISKHKGRDVYKAEAIVECHKCPFRQGCEVSCPAQDSYMRRDTKPESNPPEYSLVPYDDFEKGMYKSLSQEDMDHCEYGDWSEEDLPLDCLTDMQRKVIEMTLYEGLEQSVISYRLGIGQPRVSSHKHRAIRKMTEFGRARKVIREEGAPQRVTDYYVNNLSQAEIATKYDLDQGNLSKYINNWYNLNCSK